MAIQSSSYPERRRLRMAAYDYAESGAYFITGVTEERLALFGHVVDDQMRLSELGRIVDECWKDLVTHYAALTLDEFVVMPNHVHGVIWLGETGRAGFKPAPTNDGSRPHGLPEMVRAFKTFSARRINALRGTSGVPVWQRSYYERVIRNDRELNAIREYIRSNPVNWQLDREHLPTR